MKELDSLENKLIDAKEISYEQRNLLPDKPGCYLIREKGVIRYIGETRSLKKRMRDLGITYNHSFRRTIGFKLLRKKATSSSKYEDADEKKINNYFKKHITISYVEVSFGRKELEEQMVKNHRKTLYNKASKR